MRTYATPMQPVIDPASWTGEELSKKDGWIFELTNQELQELDDAINLILEKNIDIKDITPNDFLLPTLRYKLADIKQQLMEGVGISLLRGIPVDKYSVKENAIAFWGMSRYLGDVVSQNGKGHLLGHVANIFGEIDLKKNAQTRGNNTNSRLNYHTDSCDAIGLFCLQKAKSGGISSVASSVRIYNEMLAPAP